MAGQCGQAAQRQTAVTREFAGRTSTIAAARHFGAETASELGFDADFESCVALVVSELASNAVQASDRSYSVRIERTDGGGIAVTVANQAVDPQLPARPDWGPDEPLAARGRGLGIVEHLAADVDVDVASSSVTVTALLTTRG